MKVSELFEGVDTPRRRPASVIQLGAKAAAEELRKKGLKVRIDARVIGRHEKSDRATMTVTGNIEEKDILRVLKKHEVVFVTVGSKTEGDTKVRMIRLVQPPLKEETDGKAKKIAQLKKDYADKMRWAQEAKEKTGADREKHGYGASKIKAHLKSQYGVNVDEAIAGPFKKFKKGQMVTVKKTGVKVEVLKQNDIGLVFTMKSGSELPDLPKGTKVVQGKGYQEYMPQELE